MNLSCYWIFAVCGTVQLFTLSAPMAVAAQVPGLTVVAAFAAWLVILASAAVLYRARVAALLALLGSCPSLIVAFQALLAREFGLAAMVGVASGVASAFSVLRLLRGQVVAAAPFRGQMSRMTRGMLSALPLGFFLVTLVGWVLR
jgi:hypothetical protein